MDDDRERHVPLAPLPGHRPGHAARPRGRYHRADNTLYQGQWRAEQRHPGRAKPGPRPGGLSMGDSPFPRRPLLVHRDHRRTFEDNLYVYAVVSRRSHGISIGINLNPDKVCNFDCVYCQVDRKTPPVVRTVDVPRLLEELEDMLDLVLTGALFDMERFRDTPAALRRLNDIAFSGDGEPTTALEYLEVVRSVAGIKQRRRLSDVKLVLITNATMFHRPAVKKALAILDANHG